MATVFDEENEMVKRTLIKAHEMRAMLADLDEDTQGCVLADLVAVWIVQHRLADDHAADANELQLDMLMAWLSMVVRLIPAHEQQYLKQLGEKLNPKQEH